jgi:hypothetical protein
VTAADPGQLVANEFAAVVVSVVRHGHGTRLRLRDRESGATVLLDPLDLQSLCLADEAAQASWLRVGAFQAPHAAGSP